MTTTAAPYVQQFGKARCAATASPRLAKSSAKALRLSFSRQSRWHAWIAMGAVPRAAEACTAAKPAPAAAAADLHVHDVHYNHRAGHQLEWETSATGCCGNCNPTDTGVCMEGMFCPCVLYSQNKAAIDGKEKW